MTDKDEKTEDKKPLTLSAKTLTLKKGAEGGQVRQSFTHGRSKTVTVEVKKKRIVLPGQNKAGTKLSDDGKPISSAGLTHQQIEERLKSLHGAMKSQADESERSRQEQFEEQARLKELEQAESAPQEVAVPEAPTSPTETETPASSEA